MPNKGKHLKTKPRMEEKDPERAGVALLEYVDTGSYRAASRKSGMDANTVQAIAERNPLDFQQIKKRRGDQHMLVAGRLLDDLETADLTGIAPMQKSIMAGIHTQRGLECYAREIPMMFDPQLARRCIEESEFWRKQMQQPVIEEKSANAQDATSQDVQKVSHEPEQIAEAGSDPGPTGDDAVRPETGRSPT